MVLLIAMIQIVVCDAACGGEICDNNQDEDNDGLLDCDDPDCAMDPVCMESVCTDGVDNNNGDNLIDCDDPDCASNLCCSSLFGRIGL